jgi:hypothetical protein
MELSYILYIHSEEADVAAAAAKATGDRRDRTIEAVLYSEIN